jgi:four helix bundle protein
MKIQQFEDIIAWQKSKELCISIYASFYNCKDFGFRDQLQRAAVSIMNNIAEGYERQTDKEFRQGLYIAKGSCGELRSMISLSKDLNLIDPETASSLEESAIEISKILSGLIRSLS